MQDDKDAASDDQNASASLDTGTVVTSKASPFSHGTRAFQELYVGAYHVVEVVINVRRLDWKWFHNNYEEEVEAELLDLLEESVLPRMFSEELEEYYRQTHKGWFPPAIAGSKNQTASGRNAAAKRKGKASKRKAPVVEEKTDEKPSKDVYYAFGETIQVAYRKQEIKGAKQNTTLTAFMKDDSGSVPPSPATTNSSPASQTENSALQFGERVKLSHRLLVWCCKLDPTNATNPDPPNFGFSRPEMVPIASLFKQPDGIEGE